MAERESSTRLVGVLPESSEGVLNEARDDSILVAHELGVPSIMLAILGVMRSVDMATISQIADEVETTRNGLSKHLDVLERLGVITRSVRRVRGSFRPAACYQLDTARLEEIAWLTFEAFVPHHGD